jgi:hypothetical protein
MLMLLHQLVRIIAQGGSATTRKCEQVLSHREALVLLAPAAVDTEDWAAAWLLEHHYPPLRSGFLY